MARVRLDFFVLVLIFSYCLFPAVPARADTIRVGIVAPFSGEFGRWGQQFQRGIEVFQSLNGMEIGPHTVEIIYRDSGGIDPTRAKRLAEELIIRERVNFLGGFVFTPNALSVAPVISEARVPALIFNAAASNITRGSDYFIRTSYTVPQVTLPVANWARDNGYDTIVSIIAEYSPGIDAEEAFERIFTERGGQVLEQMRVPVATSDFAPFFERIRGIAPDGVFMFGPGGPASVGMVRAWAARLKDEGIGLLVTNEMPELELPNFGPDAVGIIGSSSYLYSLENATNLRMKQRLRELFGEEAFTDPALIAAFDGMQLIYNALEMLGDDLSGEAAVAAIRGMRIESPRGEILIDGATGDIVQNVYLQRVDSRDGRLVNLPLETYPMVKDPWKEWNPE